MRITIVAVHVAACLASAALAWGEPAQQILITPDQLTWSAGPPTVPPGVQIAVLAGDPAKAGPFTIRARFPDGYRLPSHTHPIDERVTVDRARVLPMTATPASPVTSRKAGRICPDCDLGRPRSASMKRAAASTTARTVQAIAAPVMP